MIRRTASYPRAIEWLAFNEDLSELANDEPALSVAASLVADLFSRTEAEIVRDLRREVSR